MPDKPLTTSDPNNHFARKALLANLGLAPGGLGTRQCWRAGANSGGYVPIRALEVGTG